MIALSSTCQQRFQPALHEVSIRSKLVCCQVFMLVEVPAVIDLTGT